jgi:hypothetical protein
LLELAGRQHAAGNLAAHHLDTGLALAIDAMLESEGAELIFGDLSGEKLVGPFAESLDFLADGNLMLLFEFLAFLQVSLGDCRHNRLYLYRDCTPTITPIAIGIDYFAM